MNINIYIEVTTDMGVGEGISPSTLLRNFISSYMIYENITYLLSRISCILL